MQRKILILANIVLLCLCFGCSPRTDLKTADQPKNVVIYSGGPTYREGISLPKQFDSSLSLECAAPSKVEIGTPLQITVTVTNKSDHPCGLRGFNDATTSLLQVYSDGHEVAQTDLGKKFLIDEQRFPWRLIESEGSSPGNELLPNQSYSYTINVGDYFQIGRPGFYLVIIKRRGYDAASDAFSRLVSGAVIEVVARQQ